MTDTTTGAPVVTVAMIGTGTGDGGLTPITDGTKAITPDHQPNVIFTVIGPALAIAVRFVNRFLLSLGGSIGISDTPLANWAPANLQHLDFHALAILALSAATVGLLKDLITVFGRLEQKYPLATGSV
jgi:hypothetical protein